MPATITQNSKPLHPRALDTSGNNNHGTAYTGQGLEFDGVADYIQLSDLINSGISMLTTSGALSSQDNRTFAFWHKSNGSIASTQQVFSAAGGGGGTGMGIGIATDGDIVVELKAGGVRHTARFTAGMGDSTWKRHVVVFDAVNKAFLVYVDGVAITANFEQNVGGWSGSSTSVTGYLGSLNGSLWPIDGCLSDFQCWDALWTASDATYDYLNPEKLALDAPSTSLTYSDLKLWYPMNDSTRGQQINVMDGANTGLGASDTDIVTDLTFTVDSNWSQDGNSFTNDGTSTGRMYKSAATVGKTYKISYDITAYTSGALRVELGTSNDAGADENSGIGSYSQYFTAKTNTNIYVNQSGLAFVGTFDNLSIIPINDKNHGTSVFYGDNLITNGGFETDVSGWTDYNGSLASGPTHNTSHAKVGAESLSFLCNAIYEAVKTTYTTVTGRTYTVSFWAKPLDSESQIRVTIIEGDGSGSIVASNYALSGLSTATGTVGSGDWYNFTYTYTEVSGGSSAEIRIGADGSDADTTFAIDEVSIKEVGFAKGWTEADAETTIPQLGFQSYNQLAWFDGTAGHVALGSQSTGENKSITFSAWIYMVDSGSTAVQPIILLGDTHLRAQSDTSIKVYPDQGVGSTTITVPSLFNKWHHIVFTSTNGDPNNTNKVYIDGVLVGSGVAGGDTSSDSVNSYIGRHGGDYFSGAITEVSYWEEALTTAKAQELYNDGEALDATLHSSVANLAGYWRNRGTGTWTDLSTNSNNGTATSITEYLTLPEGNNSRDTQGFLMNRTSTSGIQHTGAIAGSYSRFGHGTQLLSTPVSNASVECWFRSFGGTGASESYATFFGSRASNNILLCRNATAGTVSGLYYLTSGGNQNNLDSTTNCFDDEWHHIAFTFDSGVGKLYIDGSLEDTQDDTGDTIRMGSDTYYMETGADSVQGSRSFSGDVDDIGVYSTTLTANQVARNYKAGKARHRD